MPEQEAQRYRFGPQNGVAALQHGVREFCQVYRGRKKTGVTGYAAQYPGIFVLHFALDYAVAERAAGLVACVNGGGHAS